MADLGYTNAQWTRIMREFGLALRVLRVVRELESRFEEERTQIVNRNDYNANFDAATLSGVHFGTNTAEDGTLYVRVTGTGPYTVSLYTAAGASGLVAQGSANASATATLTAQNSSGLTGTVDLAASVTAETDDVHQFGVYTDFRAELINIFPSDGTTDKDTASRARFNQMLKDLAADCQTMKNRIKAALAAWAIQIDSETDGRLQDFLGTASSTLVADVANPGASGEVNRTITGLLVDLRLAMRDETTGSTQDVIKRTISAGAGVADSNNDGQGAIASHTPGEQCPPGTATLRCVAGKDTGDGGEERFSGEFKPTDPKIPDFALSNLQVEQAFTGPFGFGPITLTRTLSKTGDGSNNIFTAASNASVTGENDENTDGGVLYWKTTANASNWDVAFYNSSNRLTGDKVAEALNIASGAAFNATAKNGSGLQVDWQLGGTESATTGTLDLAFFVTENSDGVPDSFTIAVTESGTAGLAQKIVTEEFGYYLNSDTSGSEQVGDGLLAKANTFEPFINQDN